MILINDMKTTAFALIFDRKFTYYGGTINRLAIFETLEDARAFAKMFTRKKDNYSIQKVTISIYKEKTNPLHSK